MRMKQAVLIWAMLAALPAVAGADVIPISDVNENAPDGYPLLRGEIVTVRGVAVVGTGTLATTTDIYIQDDTGGVNVRQSDMASPVIAVGDSVEVTGRVDHATSSGRTALFVNTDYPSTRMRILNSGNPVPEPLELTPREIATGGEELEGIYAVVRDVSLAAGAYWPDCGGGSSDSYTRIADDDTLCWMWFDRSTDLCGSEAPLAVFEVTGVIVPDIQPSLREGHGVLPFERSAVLSSGPGSGFATVDPSWVSTGETVDLAFDFEADGGTLTKVQIELPVDWDFSGNPSHVELDGPAFTGATVVSTPDWVLLNNCALTGASPGTVTFLDVTAPDHAGTFVFDVATGVASGGPAYITTSPEVGVGAQADAGAILINEVYAYSGGSDGLDRAEFIELYNPGGETVDLTGWVLTDISDDGECRGSDLWAFPEGAEIAAGGYVVVAKDAKFNFSSGFHPVFGFYPDYELFDPYQQDLDWPDGLAPNMTLVSPDDGDPSESQEIRLLGGSDGDGAMGNGSPAYEAVLLYSDQTLGFLVDAVEYRSEVFLASDPCVGAEGLGGPHDSWTPGPPPRGVSLARNATSDDTDDSSVDLALVGPTPGDVNPDSDTDAPTVASATGASHNIAIVVFSEPVDPDDAVDLVNYAIGDGVMVTDVQLSRDGRTVLLYTTDRTPGVSYSIAVDGVRDISGNPMEMYSGSIYVSDATLPIEVVQEYDDQGLCLRVGETVRSVGFVTVPAGVFQPEYTSMYMQEHDGSGINVFAYGQLSEPALEGDLISATGQVVDYISSSSGAGATTEISASSISVLARGFDPIPPTVMLTGDVGHEDNEGLFVQTSGVVVSVEGFAIYIDDGSGSIQIYQNFNDLDFSVFAVGDSVRMTGVILQYDQYPPFFAGYELSPRYDYDMEILSAHYSNTADVTIDAKVLDAGAGETIEISYNAPRATQVTVRIFDLKGREVATLFDGTCLGPQRSMWDGRDDEGRRVPMGVYICHVLARNQDRGDGTNASAPIVVGAKLD